MCIQQEIDNNNNQDDLPPGCPKHGALVEWLEGCGWDHDLEGSRAIEEDEQWWNPFTMTHGTLTETNHSDVPDHATFGQVTGTMYDIKTFLESNVMAPGDIIYTSTHHFIPQFIFKMLPLKREREWKDVLCNLKFDYVGDVTDDQWTQFFAPYGLGYLILAPTAVKQN